MIGPVKRKNVSIGETWSIWDETNKEFYFCMYTVLLGWCMTFIQVYMTWILTLYGPQDALLTMSLFMIGSAGQIYLHIISIKTLDRYKIMIIGMPCIWYLTFIILHVITSIIAEQKIFNENINIILFASTGTFILSLCVGLRMYLQIPTN